jgi:zinc protease
MRVLEQVIPVIFQGSRYAERMPIGKMAVLEHAGAADLRRFYDRWYRPDLMAVVAVGDFDVAAVEREIHKAFAPIPRPTTPAERPVYPVPSQPQTLVAVARDPELTATSVGILHKMPRRPDFSEGDYRRHIVEGLYHAMLNARLEEQSRTTEPPFLSAASTTEDLVRPTEVFAQVAAVRQDGVSRGLEAIAREVERVDRHGFTPGELARAKAETLRRMQALAKERQNLPSDAFADELVRHYLTGEAVPGIEAELRLHQRYLPTVALPEMNVIARDWLRERDRVLLVEAPKAAKVPSGDALLGVLHAVQRSPLPAYVDRASDRPLLARRPTGGRITSTRHLPALDVTEWRLSNGVRVVVKPTTFKRDEVLLAAVSPGGASLVADRDYLSARFAGEIVGQSGYGPFDPTELRNVLAGKLVSISPAIDELTEGVLAEASPDDLQTLFELVYLAFTAPRRDERVFAAFQAQLADQLAHRTADPEEAFSDRRLAVLFGGHPRRHPLQPGDEKRIALDRVLDIYRGRFANAADFTFVLVGNVQPNTLAPLVSRYLGALPARGAHERWKDRGVRPVAGVHRFEVRQGIEPKSLVDLVFTGPERWSREEDQRLRSLIEVLGIRLREVLREGMSGTYSVGVTGDLQRRPDQEYRAEITFGCAPQNVEPLVGATFAELEALRAGKLPAGYLEKVQAAQRRALEQATTTNGYWLGHLVEHYQYGTDPTLILHERELIDGVTEGGLEQTAQRVFDQHRYVLGLLQPQRSAVSAGPGAAPR